jgi:hypothetical protein
MFGTSFMANVSTGGGGGFSPPDVGTVLLDLDARHVTLSGSDVLSMVDQSGNAYDAVAPAGPPDGYAPPLYVASDANYNDLPSVHFPVGAVSALTTTGPSSIGTDPFTLVVIGHVSDDSPVAPYFVTTNSGLSASAEGTTWKFDSNGDEFSTGFDATVPAINVFIFNGASSKFYQNDKTATSVNMTTAHNVSSGWHIGSYRNDNAIFSASGPITRVIIYAGALLQADVETLLDGLGALYGFTIGPP